jgi:predicted transposase YdaD
VEVRKLLAATYVLTGLRMPSELVAPLFQGLQIMRESSTYQAILDEGRVAGLQRMLLSQGSIRLGSPDEATKNAVKSITDGDRLERMGNRLMTATTWAEVLATP